jgi:hypothetical protein
MIRRPQGVRRQYATAGHDVAMDRLDDDVRARLQTAMFSPRSARELHAIGLTDNDLRRLVRRGAIQRYHRRYVGAHLDSALARIWCTRAAHPGAAVSHFTASRVRDLRVWVDRRRPDHPPVDVTWLTRPAVRGRAGRSGDVVLRLAQLDPCDVTYHNGLPVTRDARTVADLARELPLREAVVTVDHALTVAVTRADICETLRRQGGWPGVERARLAVAFGDPRSESALESIARVAFASAGLPAPVLQASFCADGRWQPERVDFWWPQFRTVAEADGLAKYDADSARERRDLLRHAFVREQRIADLGLEIVRFGWEDVVPDAGTVAGRLRAAFTRGLRRHGEPPVWRTVQPPEAASQ